MPRTLARWLARCAALVVAAARLCCACTPDDGDADHPFTERELARIHEASPLPPAAPDPTNAVESDPRAARLGQFLFFDPRLSPAGVACATCHDPALGFGDGVALSEGIARLARNAPTLWNATYQRWYFWDGRSDSLWAQAMKPLEAPAEMGSSRTWAVRLIASDAALREAYEAIFGVLPPALAAPEALPEHARPVAEDPLHPHQAAWDALSEGEREAINRVASNLAKAIAAYEHRLVTGVTPFDRYVEGLRDGDEAKRAAMTPAAVRGLALFMGRAECWSCHNGPTLSDGAFHNLGLAAHAELPLDYGRGKGIFQILGDEFNGLGPYSDAPEAAENDKLRHLKIDLRAQDGAFKTPGLRNVALTAPYMHDGRFATLEEVVRFYSTLEDEPSQAGHREETLFALELSDAEIADLVAFLEALTEVEPVDASLRVPPPSPR